jgi:hypothetical protein
MCNALFAFSRPGSYNRHIWRFALSSMRTIFLKLGLPSFFQRTGTTVLEELSKFDVSIKDDDCGLDLTLAESTYAALDDNDDETFGDLQQSALPEYFNSNIRSQEHEKLRAVEFPSYQGSVISQLSLLTQPFCFTNISIYCM